MRLPIAEGSFYPSGKEQLSTIVKMLLSNARPASSPCISLICPHAAYEYSGQTAAYSYQAAGNLEEEGLSIVFIGPNHFGEGEQISVSLDDWLTPLGISRCDTELANAILENSAIATPDEEGHAREHSIEVQLPFLQQINPQAKIACISMLSQDLDSSMDIGNAIFEAVKDTEKKILVIASSDFSHYETAEKASALDAGAMEKIQVLDYSGFQEKVEKSKLSICGHGPISAALYYSRLCKAKTAELLNYSNSGEAEGQTESVVSYASFAVRK